MCIVWLIVENDVGFLAGGVGPLVGEVGETNYSNGLEKQSTQEKRKRKK